MSIKKETIKNDYDSLDYIYIEKYRGIYHREFYFSNEYKYIYDGKHLKREKNNTDHISGFFGNKVEINAAIGMNGSGKTSLLSAITSCFSPFPFEEKTVLVLVFRSGKVYYICSNVIEKYTYFFEMEEKDEVIFEFNDETKVDSISNWECVFHSGVYDYQTFLFPHILTEIKGKNISTSATMYEYSQDAPYNSFDWDDYTGKTRNAFINYFSSGFKKQITLLSNFAVRTNSSWLSNKNIDNSYNLKWPAYASVFVKDIHTICNELTWQCNHVFINSQDITTDLFISLFEYLEEGKDISRNVFEQFKGKISPGIIAALISKALAKSIKIKNNIVESDLGGSVILIKYILAHLMDESRNDIQDGNKAWDIVCSTVDQLKKNNIDNTFLKISEQFPSINSDTLKSCLNNLSKSTESVCDIIELINKHEGGESAAPDHVDSFRFYVPGYSVEDDADNYINIPLDKLFKAYRPIGMVYSFLDFSWNLSSGEQARLELFSRINSYYEDAILLKGKKELDFHNILLLLDEADMFLHPEWQRNYIDNLIEFLEELFKDDDVHIQVIIASHSPIMLSDVPKQNTLFLTQNANVKQPETFAANIYSLFKNTFFINDSMIGSFAEKKLQKLASDIYSINDNSKHDEIKKRINIIGDEFVRKQFMDLYYKKINIPNQVEVLQERVKELESELKKLKAQTHEKEGSE